MNISQNTTLNTLISVLGLVLTIGLAQAGCQQAEKSTSDSQHVQDAHADHDHSEEPQKPPFVQVEDADLADDADLDEVVNQAISNIEKGRADGDMMLVMNGGIMKLKAVLERDPENVKAINQLGVMSVESGQLEKAEKRFEKLVLLQPENQEYAERLSEIQSKLGK